MALHQYPVDYVDDWQPKDARAWYSTWLAEIPRFGCSCHVNWAAYTAENPPDFSEALKFFEWSVTAHNYVSEHHVTPRKAPMSLADAMLTYCPKPADYWSGRLVAVTSLSPSAAAVDRQQRALLSWQRFGLQIHSVNSAAEVGQLRPQYPQVDVWQTRETMTTDYERPTQRINTLAEVAIEIDLPILLINSDIEIHGHPERLEAVPDDALLVGIRHNYQGSRFAAKREPWGLDVFRLTPAMARTLPQLPLGIGRPVWDYWLPHHFRELGFRMDFVGDPLFFHQEHERQWSDAEWQYGARVLLDHYGVELCHNSASFRNSFPFPPGGK